MLGHHGETLIESGPSACQHGGIPRGGALLCVRSSLRSCQGKGSLREKTSTQRAGSAPRVDRRWGWCFLGGVGRASRRRTPAAARSPRRAAWQTPRKALLRWQKRATAKAGRPESRHEVPRERSPLGRLWGEARPAQCKTPDQELVCGRACGRGRVAPGMQCFRKVLSARVGCRGRRHASMAAQLSFEMHSCISCVTSEMRMFASSFSIADCTWRNFPSNT